MAKHSAGILVFRRRDDGRDVEVLLAHMGGPFWARRERGAWTLPKGELQPGEEPLEAARREFREELGLAVPSGPTFHLGEIRQAGGKRVEAWAVEGDLDPEQLAPGTFELEWPPGSGRCQSFPEIDRVAWFTREAAADRIIPGQRPLLDRLSQLVLDRGRDPTAPDGVDT